MNTRDFLSHRMSRLLGLFNKGLIDLDDPKKLHIESGGFGAGKTFRSDAYKNRRKMARKSRLYNLRHS